MLLADKVGVVYGAGGAAGAAVARALAPRSEGLSRGSPCREGRRGRDGDRRRRDLATGMTGTVSNLTAGKAAD